MSKLIDADKLREQIQVEIDSYPYECDDQAVYRYCQYLIDEAPDLSPKIEELDEEENEKSADSISSHCGCDAKSENKHNKQGDFVFELRQIIGNHRYSDIYGDYTKDEAGMAAEILELCRAELNKRAPEGLDEAAKEWCKENHKGIALAGDKKSHYLADGLDAFIAGADWQKEQDEETIELAEDHALLAGMVKVEEQMKKDAIEVTVYEDVGGYPFIPAIEMYDYDKDEPTAKKGDKVKVYIFKEQ